MLGNPTYEKSLMNSTIFPENNESLAFHNSIWEVTIGLPIAGDEVFHLLYDCSGCAIEACRTGFEAFSESQESEISIRLHFCEISCICLHVYRQWKSSNWCRNLVYSLLRNAALGGEPSEQGDVFSILSGANYLSTLSSRDNDL